MSHAVKTEPMMKCGCVAMAVCHRRAGKTYEPPVPACLIHDCIAVADVKPDLTGRLARCDYFGRRGGRDYGPIYGGGKCSRKKCECLVPSDFGLPFFRYRSDKAEDQFFCGCLGWD